MKRNTALLSVLVLLTLSSTAWPISFLSMVQWDEASGGNGHWYGIMDETMAWGQAGDEANAFLHGGYNGYLATVSSADENDFDLPPIKWTVS